MMLHRWVARGGGKPVMGLDRVIVHTRSAPFAMPGRVVVSGEGEMVIGVQPTPLLKRPRSSTAFYCRLCSGFRAFMCCVGDNMGMSGLRCRAADGNSHFMHLVAYGRPKHRKTAPALLPRLHPPAGRHRTKTCLPSPPDHVCPAAILQRVYRAQRLSESCRRT